MYLIYLRPYDVRCLIKILQKYGIKWCGTFPLNENYIIVYTIEGKVGLLINAFYSDEILPRNKFVFMENYWDGMLRRKVIKHEIKEVKSINEFIGKFLVDKNENAV